MKSSLPLLTGLIILSQSILSVSAAVPTSPPTGGTPCGVFSQYFSHIKSSPSLIAGNVLTDCNGSNYNDVIIVGFEVSNPVNIFQPKCKLISQILSNIAPIQAGKALQGFSAGIPQYVSISAASSQWSGTSPGNIYYTGTAVGIGTSTPLFKLHTIGDIYASGGWLRSSGDTGWYSQTYGGGIYMIDASWVRTFNSKSFWTNNFLGSNAGLTVGYGGAASPAAGAIISGNVGIGTAAPTQKLHVVGNVLATGFLYSSDKNLKKDITPLSGSLSKILSLNGYTYNWKSTGQRDIGVIAQEVEEVYPELVHTDASGIKSVEYANLIAPLIEAIKEQQKEIDALKSQVVTLSQK